MQVLKLLQINRMLLSHWLPFCSMCFWLALATEANPSLQPELSQTIANQITTSLSATQTSPLYNLQEFNNWSSVLLSVNRPTDTACPQPALSRLTRHQVLPGETLDSIARQYNLIPATLIGMNSSLRSGQVTVGTEIVVPPFNGIRVEVPAGQSWQQVAAAYQVRADVLFEVNGCQPKPGVVFVPGVNWSPTNSSGKYAGTNPGNRTQELTGYPLPQEVTIALGYGWQVDPATGAVVFHGGLDLLSATGTTVLAVGSGTVAFAGEQGAYGNLVVVNHQQGLQTRYAHLASVKVRVGQQVKQGDILGTVGSTGTPSSTASHLHFEVRTNSTLGWVAENPIPYLKPKR